MRELFDEWLEVVLEGVVYVIVPLWMLGVAIGAVVLIVQIVHAIVT